MKHAVNTLLWTAGFGREHIPLLARIREGGFEGVELAAFAFDGFPAADIRRALEQNGLGCTFCTAMTGRTSLAGEDAATREQAGDFLRQAIDACAEVGAEVLAGPLISPVGYLPGRRRTADEWKHGVEGLRKAGEYAAKAGLILAMEPLNRFETYFLNTVEDGVKLCEEVGNPNVGLLVDTFHSNIEEKSVGDAYRKAGKHLKHVHACENDRGIPGSGHVEWNDVRDALAEVGYDGWVVIESFGFAIPEIVAAACIWRDLAANVDQIAFEGVRFLKSNVTGHRRTT